MQQLSLMGAAAPQMPPQPASKRHYDAGATSEWYTPAEYVDAARATMGGIDLDPASCEFANRTVKAGTYFDRAEDGLRLHWFGRVWLNPPYSDYRGQAAAWASKLLSEYSAGRVAQAVLLVNLSTAYQSAMQEIARVGAVCLVSHRIRFVSSTGAAQGSPTQANAIFYLGERTASFAAQFERFGAVLTAKREGSND